LAPVWLPSAPASSQITGAVMLPLLLLEGVAIIAEVVALLVAFKTGA
jgi:hypothetical protein